MGVQERSVRVRGEDLRELRRNEYSSADAFAEACQSVSVATVYRAERGGPVMRTYLNRMALLLGVPAEHLIISNDVSERVATNPGLSGNWLGLCVVPDRFGGKSIQMEEIELTQSGSIVVGMSEFLCGGRLRRDKFTDCKVCEGIFSGHSRPVENDRTFEATMFVLAGVRDMTLLRGYATWFDLDTQQPEASKYFLIRIDDPGFEKTKSEVYEILAQENEVSRQSGLLEGGRDPGAATEKTLNRAGH